MRARASKTPRPPGLATRLLVLSVARAERPFVLGDLEEEFVGLARTRGCAEAKRWYWSQALRSAGVLFLARLTSAPEARAAGAVIAGCVAAIAAAICLGCGLGFVLGTPVEPTLAMVAVVVMTCALVSSTCGGCALTWVAGEQPRWTRALVGLFVLAPDIVQAARHLAAEALLWALLPLGLAILATCVGLTLGSHLGRFVHSAAHTSGGNR